MSADGVSVASTDDSFAANGSQPAIVLNGNSLAFAGLTLSADADGSTIRGLVIKNFDVASIRIESGSSGNTIAGNYFGALNADGSHDAGAQAMTYLVDVRGDNNVIGGSTAADRNVMINNGANYGVFVFEAGAFSNRIQGNHIGTNAAGLILFQNVNVEQARTEGVETSVRYAQVCEGYRADVTSLQLSMMTYAWFESKRHLYPHLTFPGRCCCLLLCCVYCSFGRS